jgi:uncharacterized phage-associated protein
MNMTMPSQVVPAYKDDKIILAAEYFVKKNQEDIKGLDALKLQKLLYYTKAWGLVFNKGEEIFPDDFQAWVHGPANPKVYQAFKGFDFSVTHPEIQQVNFDLFTKEEKEVLDKIWNIYGKYDGKYLELLTHEEEPWQKARRDLNPAHPSQNVISDDSMRTYYERRLKEASGAV